MYQIAIHVCCRKLSNNSIHAFHCYLGTMKHDWQGCLHFCYYSSARSCLRGMHGHEMQVWKIILNCRFFEFIVCLKNSLDEFSYRGISFHFIARSSRNVLKLFWKKKLLFQSIRMMGLRLKAKIGKQHFLARCRKLWTARYFIEQL